MRQREKSAIARLSGREKGVVLAELALLLVLTIFFLVKPVREFDMDPSDPGKGYPISTGGYSVYVSYETDHYPGSVYDIAADLSFLSRENYNLVRTSVLPLDSAHTFAELRVQVEDLSSVPDFHMELINQRDDISVNISRVHVLEHRSYRAMIILKWLLIFLAADLLVLWVREMRRHFSAGGSWNDLPERLWAPAAIAGAALIVSVPCLMRYTYFGHDLLFHQERLATLGRELAYGQFPVRLERDMLNGYGYANSLFYCDLLLYPAAFLYRFYVPLQTCWHIYVFCANLLTAVFAYLAFREISGSVRIGTVGMLLYVFAAYRIIDVYERAAAGEYSAMAFLPLVLLGMWRIAQSERPVFRDWAPLAIGVAGIVQSHVLSTELIAGFLVLGCIFGLKDIFHWRKITAIGKAAVTCVLLSLWFVVPMLQTMRAVPVQATAVTNGIQASGAYLLQLFSLFVNASSTGSVPNGTTGEMPLTLGFAFLIAIAAVVEVFLRKGQIPQLAGAGGKTAAGDNISVYSQARAYRFMMVCFWLGIIATAFATIHFPWDRADALFGPGIAKILGSIQYSWRYLGFATIFLCTAAVLALRLLGQLRAEDSAKRVRVYAASMLCASAVLCGYYFTSMAFVHTEVLTQSSSNLDSMSISVGEYLLQATYNRGDGGIADVVTPVADCEEVYIENYGSHCGDISFTATNPEEEAHQVLLPVMNYGQYHLTDENGSEFSLSTGDNGRIAFELPAEWTGELTLKWREPKLWRVTEILSALTVLGLLITWGRSRKSRE